MQVTKTLDYAVRSLTYMGNQPVEKHSMRDIAQVQHIPLNYLAKIMRRLVKKGLVRSTLGPDGGYTLRKLPNEINLRDIYEAIEGEIRMVDCMDKDTVCALYETCPQLPVWDRIQLSMVKILEDTTLEDMLKERKTVILNQVN
jgi:Rrf2 family iron-sulfur cluster assembly transcriptional regulator